MKNPNNINSKPKLKQRKYEFVYLYTNANPLPEDMSTNNNMGGCPGTSPTGTKIIHKYCNSTTLHSWSPSFSNICISGTESTVQFLPKAQKPKTKFTNRKMQIDTENNICIWKTACHPAGGSSKEIEQVKPATLSLTEMPNNKPDIKTSHCDDIINDTINNLRNNQRLKDKAQSPQRNQSNHHNQSKQSPQSNQSNQSNPNIHNHIIAQSASFINRTDFDYTKHWPDSVKSNHFSHLNTNYNSNSLNTCTYNIKEFVNTLNLSAVPSKTNLFRQHQYNTSMQTLSAESMNGKNDILFYAKNKECFKNWYYLQFKNKYRPKQWVPTSITSYLMNKDDKKKKAVSEAYKK